MKERTFAILLLLAAVASVGSGEPGGTISGAVLDREGNPVRHVKVSADPRDNKIRANVVRHFETDQDGKFLIEHLAWGVYVLSTLKEEDGYPDTSFDLYNNGQLLKITLGPGAPVADIKIVLGPKAAFLSGTISDAITASPLNARIHMWRLSNPDRWLDLSVQSPYSVLIPSGTQVGIEVTVSGYMDWPGVGEQPKAGPVELGPGQRKNVDILLQPKAQRDY